MQTPMNDSGRRSSAAFAIDFNPGLEDGESEAPTEIVCDSGASGVEDFRHLLLPSSGEGTHSAPSGEKVHLSLGSVGGDRPKRRKTTGGPTPPASMSSTSGTGRRSGHFTSSRLKRRREERRIPLEGAPDASELPALDGGDGGTRDVRDDDGKEQEQEPRSHGDDSTSRPRLSQAEVEDIHHELHRAAGGHGRDGFSPIASRKISFDECGRSAQGSNSMQDGGHDDQVFDDEVWSESDLAAIDRSVAVATSRPGHCASPSPPPSNPSGPQQRPSSGSPPDAGTTELPVASSMPPNDGIPSYDFDNDDDDKELNELDLEAIARGEAREADAPLVAPPSRDSRTSTAGEFSEDDNGAFENMDLSALDSKIEERRRQLTAQSRHPPPTNAPIRNRRCHPLDTAQKTHPLFLSFTRYVVRVVHDDPRTFTKSVAVALWESGGAAAGDPGGNAPIDGYLHLRGTWYYTDFHPGDVVHLCSLSGEYMTDAAALPVVLDSSPPVGSDANDDLLLVIHPDDLLSPTLVSESVTCPRLAVLQSRLGSTRLGAKPAVIGTLRHELFQRCLRQRDATPQSGALFTREILRQSAGSLVGCGVVDQKEAFSDVMAILPQVRSFLATYTSWDMPKFGASLQPRGGNECAGAAMATMEGMLGSCDLNLAIRDVHSTEEWTHVPELGLK